MAPLRLLLAHHDPGIRPELAAELAAAGLEITVSANQADTWTAARSGAFEAVLLVPVSGAARSAELRSLLDLATDPAGPALVLLSDRTTELEPWPEGLDDVLSPGEGASGLARRLRFSVARRGPLRRLADEREALRRQSQTDFKTRLCNDRHFTERCRIECARAAREQRPLSVLMIDLDQFKAINDEHDHAFGDHALQYLADTLRDHLRPFDTAARLGGDEFAVLLPNTALDDATRIAERLRAAVAASEVVQGEHRAHLSITLGVATWEPGPVQDFDRVRIAADQALLAAKRDGRNRVGVHRDAARERARGAPAGAHPRTPAPDGRPGA